MLFKFASKWKLGSIKPDYSQNEWNNEKIAFFKFIYFINNLSYDRSKSEVKV